MSELKSNATESTAPTELTEFDCPINNGKLVSKALTYSSWRNLSVSSIEIPQNIEPDEILLQVKAVSINPIDILLYRLCFPFLSFQSVFGGDFSGVVVRSGINSGYSEGDSVFGYRLEPFSTKGTFSQYIVVNPKRTIFCDKIPDGMIYEQAASLPCTAATGYGVIKSTLLQNKLITRTDDLSNILKGKRIFIIGAGTSVGSYAVQFAKKYMNADKVVVTCSARSLSKLENLGADLTVDYTQGIFKTVNEILQFVKENGKFDIIIDCVRDETFLDYLDSILKDSKENGSYSQVYGSSSMHFSSCSILSIILPSYKSLKLWFLGKLGFVNHNLYSYKVSYDPTFASVVQTMWKSNNLEIPIDSMYRGWVDYEKAIARVGSGRASGKVVCIL